MTATQFSPLLLGRRAEAEPYVTWGMFIAAAALALLIGQGSIDIHQQHTPDSDQTENWEQNRSKLHGRGKTDMLERRVIAPHFG